MDFSVIKRWRRELKRMNRGRRFEYPNSLISFLGSIRLALHLPYRQLEGFTRGLSRYIKGLKAPDDSRGLIG